MLFWEEVQLNKPHNKTTNSKSIWVKHHLSGEYEFHYIFLPKQWKSLLITDDNTAKYCLCFNDFRALKMTDSMKKIHYPFLFENILWIWCVSSVKSLWLLQLWEICMSSAKALFLYDIHLLSETRFAQIKINVTSTNFLVLKPEN